MKNNVTISLTSIQWQDGEKSESELLTKAEYHREKNFHVFSYEDTSATGFEGCVTTLKIDGGRSASIIRRGNVNSVLNIEIGKKHYCQYATPYGDFQLGIFTHAINNNIDSDGKLYMKYSLDIESSLLSDNEIILKIVNHND